MHKPAVVFIPVSANQNVTLIKIVATFRHSIRLNLSLMTHDLSFQCIMPKNVFNMVCPMVTYRISPLKILILAKLYDECVGSFCATFPLCNFSLRLRSRVQGERIPFCQGTLCSTRVKKRGTHLSNHLQNS